MKALVIILLATFSINCYAEDKTALAKAAEAIQPAIQGVTGYVSKSVMQSMAAGKSPMAIAAQKQLDQQTRSEQLANRGTRKSMRECIKPDNVIDDDVKECMDGTRQKTW
ncbi:hypothetical protein ACVA51_24940 (plasmid) [Pseudomonas luteola]